MSITVYTFEDEEGIEVGVTSANWPEAQEYAKQSQLAAIANTYEWDDSELVEDYRPGHALDGTKLEETA